MPSELDNLDRRPLYARVAEGITTMILDEGLKPGDDLPSEAALCARTGVSRVVVRGALAQLAGAGLIKLSNGRRPRVTSMNAAVLTASLSQGLATAQFSVSQALDVRNGIETSTAALAAENRSSEDIARLAQLCDQMEQAKDSAETFADLDFRFHLAIAEATGNPLYSYIVQSLREIIKTSVIAGRLAQSTSQEKRRILEDHRAIQSAIATGSAQAAAQAMQSHFNAAHTALMRDPAPQSPGVPS